MGTGLNNQLDAGMNIAFHYYDGGGVVHRDITIYNQPQFLISPTARFEASKVYPGSSWTSLFLRCFYNKPSEKPIEGRDEKRHRQEGRSNTVTSGIRPRWMLDWEPDLVVHYFALRPFCICKYFVRIETSIIVRRLSSIFRQVCFLWSGLCTYLRRSFIDSIISHAAKRFTTTPMYGKYQHLVTAWPQPSTTTNRQLEPRARDLEART